GFAEQDVDRAGHVLAVCSRDGRRERLAAGCDDDDIGLLLADQLVRHSDAPLLLDAGLVQLVEPVADWADELLLEGREGCDAELSASLVPQACVVEGDIVAAASGHVSGLEAAG